jgi:hypothetical protein
MMWARNWVISDYNYGIIKPRVLDVLEYLQREYLRLIASGRSRTTGGNALELLAEQKISWAL